MRWMFPVAAAALAACTPASESTEAPQPACDYQCTLDAHLAAIGDHDWGAFEATITSQPEIQLILPDGRLIDGREAYLEILEPWLTAGGFTFDTETLDQRIGAELGYTLLRVTQTSEGEDAPSIYYLLLAFALEEGEWRLVHDQNTGIEVGDDGADG